MPEINEQFDRYSENKKYVITSIPYNKFGHLGKTYLLETESKKPMVQGLSVWNICCDTPIYNDVKIIFFIMYFHYNIGDNNYENVSHKCRYARIYNYYNYNSYTS